MDHHYCNLPPLPTKRTLDEHGFRFTSSSGGQLVEKESRRRFRFDATGEPDRDQARYEELGEAVTQWIYHQLQAQFHLRRIPVPVDGCGDEARGSFFASEGAESAAALLVLIHGAGAVRAGQWSRRLIINDSLRAGSQFPYIKRAQKLGWAVVVLNPNETEDESGSGIRGSESPARHGVHVWRHFVGRAAASRVAVVAHSAGGGVLGDIANRNREHFQRAVKAIALTDSYAPGNPHFQGKTCHWVCSPLPIGAQLSSIDESIPEISAGTNVHEEASAAAMEQVFEFLVRRMGTDEAVGGGAPALPLAPQTPAPPPRSPATRSAPATQPLRRHYDLVQGEPDRQSPRLVAPLPSGQTGQTLRQGSAQPYHVARQPPPSQLPRKALAQELPPPSVRKPEKQAERALTGEEVLMAPPVVSPAAPKVLSSAQRPKRPPATKAKFATVDGRRGPKATATFYDAQHSEPAQSRGRHQARLPPQPTSQLLANLSDACVGTRVILEENRGWVATRVR